MSSSVYIDDKNKDILILGEGPTEELNDPRVTAEEKHSIDFTQSRKNVVLSLHFNGSISFLFANVTKVYRFKAKASERKD